MVLTRVNNWLPHAHDAVRTCFQHGDAVRVREENKKKSSMLRSSLLSSLRVLRGRNAVVLLSHVNRLSPHLVRVSLSEAKRNSDPLISLLDRSKSDAANRSLLETFENLQTEYRRKPLGRKLVRSFGIVRKIQMESDVEQLLELYDFVKNEENFDPDDEAAISVQVALFPRFAALAGKEQSNKITDLHRVKWAADNLLKTMRRRSHHFEPAHLASAVWNIAAQGITDTSYFLHFEKEIRSRNTSLFTHKDLSMIMWAYGKAQFCASLLFKKLRHEIMARDLSRFTVEEICNIVWAYARTGEPSAKLYFALKVEILRRDLKQVEESSLIVILWSYSVNAVNIKPLFRAIKYEILRRGLHCFTHRQLSQMVGSYALQNMHAPDLFEEVSSEIMQRGVQNFHPGWLVTVADSFAKTENYNRDLFKIIGEHIMNVDLSVYEPLQVIRLFWAFINAGLLTKSLHNKLTNQIVLCDFPELKDISLEELVKALENNDFKAPELVAATEAELVRRSEGKC